MQITKPCVVALTWRLEDTLGRVIETLEAPAEFFYGGQDLFEKIEEALEEQEAGFAAQLQLEPEEAFGEYIPELVCFEPRALFPADIQTGMQLEGLPEGAQTPDMPRDRLYTITEIYDEHVVLDGNHPLAGIALRFHLEVKGVRVATEDEIASGSVSEPVFSLVHTAQPSPHHHSHHLH